MTNGARQPLALKDFEILEEEAAEETFTLVCAE